MTANDVAGWILCEAQRQGLSITHMQLQKLLYYAQGFSLGMSGNALFDDEIEAWTHGPVTSSVYDTYKRYGFAKIPVEQRLAIPDDIEPLIRALVKEKGRMSAAELRASTYAEAPWRDTLKRDIISKDKINECFSALFWASDEEDDYQPTFNTAEEEKRYFLGNITAEERHAIFVAR